MTQWTKYNKIRGKFFGQALLGVIILLMTATIWFVSCEKGDWEEPEQRQKIDLEVIVEPEGDFDCGQLPPLDGKVIPVWEMICDDHIFKSRVECNKFGIWPISSPEELNSDLQVDFEGNDCNIDFEKEMVIGLCGHRACSKHFERCDSKQMTEVNVFRFIQQYTCKKTEDEAEFFNYYLVIPKTGRDIDVKLHRYYWND